MRFLIVEKIQGQSHIRGSERALPTAEKIVAQSGPNFSMVSLSCRRFNGAKVAASLKAAAKVDATRREAVLAADTLRREMKIAHEVSARFIDMEKRNPVF